MANLMKDGEEFPIMKVTTVDVYPFKNDSSFVKEKHILGLAKITLNDQFLVRDLLIRDGVNGLYVSYPHRSEEFRSETDDEFKSTAHPFTRRLREHIEDVVLEEYQRQKGK